MVSPLSMVVAGASVAYALSVRFVFSAHRLCDRRLEFTWFVALGLVGVAINLLVLYVTVGRLGVDLVFAKAMAACCTFCANFTLRRQLLELIEALTRLITLVRRHAQPALAAAGEGLLALRCQLVPLP